MAKHKILSLKEGNKMKELKSLKNPKDIVIDPKSGRTFELRLLWMVTPKHEIWYAHDMRFMEPAMQSAVSTIYLPRTIQNEETKIGKA